VRVQRLVSELRKVRQTGEITCRFIREQLILIIFWCLDTASPALMAVLIVLQFLRNAF
jgi:hypothetical protein